MRSTLLASKVPAGKRIFSFLKAPSNSRIVILFEASFIGSIQTLILNSLKPPVCILPTFLILENWSTRYLSA